MVVVVLAAFGLSLATGGPSSPLIVMFSGPAFVAGFAPDVRGRFWGRFALFVVPSMALVALALSPWASGALRSPFALPVAPGDGVRAAMLPLTVGFFGALFALLGRTLRWNLVGLLIDGQHARNATLHEITARNRELSSIGAVIAHELKNPLASIQGLAQLMERDPAHPARTVERLGVLLREAQRMRAVVDEFRSFARPLTELSLAPSELGALAQEVVELNDGIAQARGVSLVYEPAHPIEVVCDPLRVRQALSNLVQNVLDATPRGGAVTVRAGREGARVRVTVEDTGEGLPREVLDGSFAPGFTTRPNGTGIGLVVVRSIASQHGGALRCENVAGGGARVSLELPAHGPQGEG